MDVQQMAPQQQPKRPLVKWMRVSTGFIIFLALLWRLIFWMWSILIIGIVVGVLGNALFTLLTTGKIDLTGTLTVITWLHVHLSLCLTILILTLVITFCSYLAHRWRRRVIQENQRAHDEALVVVAKGVQRALDELNTKPSALPPSPPVPAPVNEDTTPPKELWNVPYRRNPFFTGREELLKQLHDNLTATKAAALTQAQAISGLGGIGKTQTAVEYAYRYRDEYRVVLWVNAATHETLLTSYVELAALLTLPEQTEQDEQKIVAAAKQWFSTHDDWLLIFDNADELALVEEFLPARGKGHLLLTTRAYAAGTLANAMEVEKMDLHESMLLLLRRARVVAPEATLEQASAAAEAIAREMDGLPLALDQAGAYIEETQCRLSSYLEQYRQRQSSLLRRRGGTGKEHPEPVATTWSLSFEHVEQRDPLAADVLRCCAFLAPDVIPEQLLVDGATELGPGLQPMAADASLLDDAIGTLLRFSLLKRKPDEQTFTVHRLVQAIMRTSMDVAAQKAWAERTVRALKRAFPGATDYRTWSRCQQYLPHALACVLLMDQWDSLFPVTGALLNEVGYYVKQRAQYREAELLFQRAIAIAEQKMGPEHPNLATALNNLANLYTEQCKYEQAEPLLQRAIAIGEKVLGPEHPRLATWLNNLAELYRAQGKLEQAEPLLQRAIAIDETVLGPEHPDLAIKLSNLALFYQNQSKYEQAEPLLQRAIAIDETVLGPEHPDLAIRLNNLASLYKRQGKLEQAEPLLQRAIAIGEQVLGPEHPRLAYYLNNLAHLYQNQGKLEQAEPLYQRAIAIGEKVLGLEHPDLATWLNNLATLYQAQGKYKQAKPLFQRAIAIYQQTFGPHHPGTKTIEENHARFLEEKKRKVIT